MGQFAGYGNFDQRSGDAAAFRNLVGEALALCLAADPKLGADMAQLLKIERPAAIQARDGLPPIAALSTCFRMLIYAHVEAYETLELSHWVEKLEFCIEQLAERLHPVQVHGSAGPRLHS